MSKCFYFAIALVIACAVSNFSLLYVVATPATTSKPTTHIVSYVNQKKTKTKSDELSELDMQTIKGTTGAMQQLFGRFMQLQDSMDNSIATATKAIDVVVGQMGNGDEVNRTTTKVTDDLLNPQQNTLESTNEIFGNSAAEQHEAPPPSMDDMTATNKSDAWNRVKQSIPVLEPVKHLLNTVRDGSFNHTAHATRHHQLVSSGHGNHSPHQNDSAAIETEEEREMVNDSTGFKLLELLGSVAGMAWGFFSNIQKVFAASSASLSGASSQ